MITTDNWEEALTNGFRWVADLTGDPEQDRLTVASHLTEHGPDSVVFGISFDREAHRPGKPNGTNGFAVYVKDAKVFLEELEEDLLNYNCGHSLGEGEPSLN